MSPVLSTSSISDANKSESGKSPLKSKMMLSGSSTNLDKVIEAVSKGILDGSREPSIDVKCNKIDVKTTKSPKMNGFQTKLNDSISSASSEKSSPLKMKASKKAKKEKDREKDKDNDKQEETDKEKDENKNKSMDKVKMKEKIKTKIKEKQKYKEKPKETDMKKDETKRKIRLKSDVESKLCQPKIRAIKEPVSKVDENTNSANYTTESQIINESQKSEITKLESSVDSNITSKVNTSKDTQSISGEKTLNDEAFNAHSTTNGETVEIPITTPTVTHTIAMETDIERKLSRKRRKEKHRNKHGLDTERSLSKEHKKKRKRKSHDRENPEPFPLADGVPKIKIKVNRSYNMNYELFIIWMFSIL